ncbi:hypothetical protein ACQZ40_25280 [Agrobacterium sp. 16-172Ci]
MGKSRAEIEPQCGFEVEQCNGEGVIYLTIPEDAKAGDRVALWTSPKALTRLRDEIEAVLTVVS